VRILTKLVMTSLTVMCVLVGTTSTTSAEDLGNYGSFTLAGVFNKQIPPPAYQNSLYSLESSIYGIHTQFSKPVYEGGESTLHLLVIYSLDFMYIQPPGNNEVVKSNIIGLTVGFKFTF